MPLCSCARCHGWASSRTRFPLLRRRRWERLARQFGLPVEVLRGYGVSREQTRTDVAYEPVTSRLLPESDRAEHTGELTAVQEMCVAEGSRRRSAVARHLVIDPAQDDTEEGFMPQPMTSRRQAGFGHFVGTEFTAVTTATSGPADRARLPARARAGRMVVFPGGSHGVPPGGGADPEDRARTVTHSGNRCPPHGL